jgi:hypothetical protein
MQDADQLELWLSFVDEERPFVLRALAPADWWNAWHRLTGTYDGKTARLYVDGKPIASAEKVGRLSPGHFPLDVGRDPERIDRRTPARFREARVYARALSQLEVAAEARPQDGLVLWLDLADAKQVAPGGSGSYFAYGGDFGPTTTPSHENFCQNGVVAADRTPHAGLGEIKAMQQRVAVTGLDLARGEIAIQNRYDFTTLSEIAKGRYLVHADDSLIAEGALPPLDIAPRARKTFLVPLPSIDPGARGRVLARPRLRARCRQALGAGRPRASPPATDAATGQGRARPHDLGSAGADGHRRGHGHADPRQRSRLPVRLRRGQRAAHLDPSERDRDPRRPAATRLLACPQR